jgi:hypothetical protein
MVNRNDATYTEEWRDLPIEGQMGWRIPISTMLNMTLLRNRHPVITVSDFLRLHNISEDVERSNGHWGRETYHTNPNVFDTSGHTPSLHVIQEHLYDPEGVNRVDMIPEDMKMRGEWTFAGGQPLDGENMEWNETMWTFAHEPHEASVLDWNQVRQILQKRGYIGLDTDEKLEWFLTKNGWEVLYTYEGV